MELIAALGLWQHPLVLPCALIWCGLATLGWGRVRDRRERRGEPLPSVWSLLFACTLGCLLAITLTPSRIGLGLDATPSVQSWCFPQLPRTGFGLWAPNRERRWNVLIAVPLGFAAAGWFLARVPRRRRPGGRVAAVAMAAAAPVLALAVPAGVELVQALVPGLGRVCAVVDGIDNVSGVLIGFACAVPAEAALRRLHRPRRRR